MNMVDILCFPGTRRAPLARRVSRLTRVLADVFEDHPVIAAATGIAAGTEALGSGHDVPAALDVAIAAPGKWESLRGWRNGCAR